MANTYHQVYLQFVFAVKYRMALIGKEWNKELFAVIGNIINENKCKNIIVNGTADHVHCFVGLKPVISISDMMKAVKARSSKYVNEKNLSTNKFEWQDGYGVFSYGQSHVNEVFNYIQNQEEHHKKQTFLDEYRQFLKAFKIDYQEEYIFHEPI